MQEQKEQVEKVREAFEREFERFANLRVENLRLDDAENLQRELNELRVKHTGKKSELAGLNKLVGRVAPDERAAFGKLIQTISAQVNQSLDEADAKLKTFVESAKIERERIDVTLPGTRPRQGHLHLLTILRQKIEEIFVSLGYSIEDDREIETDYYNFDALNIPEGHPARESQDTFYTTNGFALRSQTSTVQIRAMERRGVPIRIIAPGRVFRRDTPDLTHTPMFHQIEGLCVDKDITMAHLKGTVGE